MRLVAALCPRHSTWDELSTKCEDQRGPDHCKFHGSTSIIPMDVVLVNPPSLPNQATGKCDVPTRNYKPLSSPTILFPIIRCYPHIIV